MGPGLRRDDKTLSNRMLYAYLLASKPYGTLYIGVTSNLPKRIFEHKSKAVTGFTSRYGVDKPVGSRPTKPSKLPSVARSRPRSGATIGKSARSSAAIHIGSVSTPV